MKSCILFRAYINSADSDGQENDNIRANNNYSILRSILGSSYFGKLPYCP